jgi:hypothetical protein
MTVPNMKRSLILGAAQIWWSKWLVTLSGYGLLKAVMTYYTNCENETGVSAGEKLDVIGSMLSASIKASRKRMPRNREASESVATKSL